MNLKEMWGHASILAQDPAMLEARQAEYVAWCNIAQDVLGGLLLDVAAWRFEKTSTLATTINVATATLPEDFSEIVLLRYDSNNSAVLYQANRIPLRDKGALTSNTFYAASNREPFYSLTGGTITLYPTPTVTTTAGLELTYRRKPSPLRLDRVKEDVVTTSAGNAGGTTLISTTLTEVDDYWNECECELKSGSYIYQKRAVSDFTASSDTVTLANAFGGQVAQTVTFSLFDVSILPSEYHYLLVYYAAAMACAKLGKQDGFQKYMGLFGAGMEGIRAKYAQPVQDQLFEAERPSKTNT